MDAIWFGCIPVLIADHYVPPLPDLIEWENIVVVVPEAQASSHTYTYPVTHRAGWCGKALGCDTSM